MSLFSQFWRGLQFLWPQHCALCRASTGVQPNLLCVGCAQAANTVRPRCLQCGIAHESISPCPRCIKTPPTFDATVVALDYAAPFTTLVTDFKFNAQLAHAHLFATLLAQQLRSHPHLVPDVLLPAPLSAARLQERGFNQSWEIAKILARQIQRPAYANYLIKVRDTPAQMSLPFKARHKNIQGAFVAARDLNGLHIGLVDDVMTTGSTLNELAQVCKRFGASRVTNLVATRTPLD